MKHDCNDCFFYNVMGGYCCHKKKAKEPHHGYDGACELFKLDPVAKDLLEEEKE